MSDAWKVGKNAKISGKAGVTICPLFCIRLNVPRFAVAQNVDHVYRLLLGDALLRVASALKVYQGGPYSLNSQQAAGLEERQRVFGGEHLPPHFPLEFSYLLRKRKELRHIRLALDQDGIALFL